ncbi:hypothetical protein [Lysinibacillus sp. 54212]|uniref:hypothetical protein n=1 Tax=Lysinibacillus sp. 54212 TaxID=3119829 RepID=UPI002FCC4130
MMKIGSPEWFKELAQAVKFPAYFSFYLLLKGDKKTVAVKVVDSKAKEVTGIKYGALEPTMGMLFNAKNIALLDVCKINNADQYYEKVKKLATHWDVEVIDEKGVEKVDT